MKYFLWIRKHFISLCGYKHLWRALVHIRACPLKETDTYTLSSERIKETEGEINIQLLCGAYLLYYSLLRNFCVVFPFLLFKSSCLSICLFPQTISPFSEFTKDDNFGITLSIQSTQRERQHTARNTKMSFMLFFSLEALCLYGVWQMQNFSVQRQKFVRCWYSNRHKYSKQAYTYCIWLFN